MTAVTSRSSRTTAPFFTEGGPGSGDGQFNQAIGVAVDASGNVFVFVSDFNNRVQKFACR